MAKRKVPPPPVPVDPATVPLSVDERRFCEEWIVDRNSSEAYRRAFPGCSHYNARRLGSLMRRRPNVAAEITAALAAQRVRSHVRADKVITELARVAFSDVLPLFTDDGERLRHPRHIPYDVRKAIASVRVSRERRTVTTKGKIRTIVTDNVIEYKFWNKNDALGRLMTHLGLTTEITPLESLLQALPRDLAEQVRGALTRQLTATAAVPSTNGKH